MLLENKLWYERYRPRTLDQCLLPSATKKLLSKYVKNKDIPNLLMSGPAGIGKTSAARVLCEQIDAEYIMIPASMRGNIDTLRTEIQQFASTVSMNGQKKYVIFDEADGTTLATQQALRGFIDNYSSNCGFIFTCNFREKILAPIAESRLTEISFTFAKDDMPLIAKGMFDSLVSILEENSIAYDVKDVQKFIVDSLKKKIDFRRLMVQAQKFSASGTFDVNGTDSVFAEKINQLFQHLKSKNFREIRTWIGENSDIGPETIYRQLYENAKEIVQPEAVGPLVVIIGKYQYQQAFVADSEINLAACMIELMTECM